MVSGEGTYAYGYDALGRPNALTYPDGHTRSQIYDDLGRITSRCYAYPGPTTRCYTAQYDAVGNPLRMTDPDGADRFEYDALDRLKKVTREVGGVDVAAEDYDYNALGALKLNAGVALDHQRPRLDGAGLADAAVPATLGGQPVTLDAGGRVTSLRGTSFTWSKEGFLRQAQDPIPAVAETYGVDSAMRRFARLQGASTELYVYEGLDRVATLDAAGAVVDSYLFDGIDHSLRVRIDATNTTAYYELDLAGNVRGLRASGGASLGGYRYTAFGQTLEDTSSVDQPLRWKGRWFSPAAAGGTYDLRARQWDPELGVFLVIDELRFGDAASTLWGWPRQSPLWPDPLGRGWFLFNSCVSQKVAAGTSAFIAAIQCAGQLGAPDPMPTVPEQPPNPRDPGGRGRPPPMDCWQVWQDALTHCMNFGVRQYDRCLPIANAAEAKCNAENEKQKNPDGAYFCPLPVNPPVFLPEFAPMGGALPVF